MRGFYCGLLAATAFSGAVQAQNEPLTEEQPAAELTELERLSRSADDPFAGVIEAQKREPISVTLRALDKITARYTDIEIAMNEIARFGALELQPRTCDKRPPEEFPETTAFLEIFDTEFDSRKSDLKPQEGDPVESDIVASDLRVLPVEPVGDLPIIAETPAPPAQEGPQAEGVNIFRGWMFASSPALNPLEHPVYDVWVIDCTTRVVSN